MSLLEGFLLSCSGSKWTSLSPGPPGGPFFSREIKTHLFCSVSLHKAALTPQPARCIGSDGYTPILTHIPTELESERAWRMMKNTSGRRCGVKTGVVPLPALMKNSWVFLLQPLHLCGSLTKEACIIEWSKPVPPAGEWRDLCAGCLVHACSCAGYVLWHRLLWPSHCFMFNASNVPQYLVASIVYLSRWMLDRHYGVGDAGKTYTVSWLVGVEFRLLFSNCKSCHINGHKINLLSYSQHFF